VSAGAEKRQHHRFMARLDVRVMGGDRVTPGLQLTTMDIGVGGARCLSPVRLEGGTLLHLTVTLAGGELTEPVSLPVDAHVLRCVDRPEPHHGLPYEAAIQFVRLEARDRRRLQVYLNGL
jgi:hypothetical protein